MYSGIPSNRGAVDLFSEWGEHSRVRPLSSAGLQGKRTVFRIDNPPLSLQEVVDVFHGSRVRGNTGRSVSRNSLALC